MRTKEIPLEMEMISYRTDDIAWATTALVWLYAKYSGIFGTEQWVKSLDSLLSIIRNQKPQEHTLMAEGLGISFSGFLPPVPSMQTEGISLKPPPPRFVIFSSPYVRPHMRTHIETVSAAIAEEMHDVYLLEVAGRNPQVLTFPTGHYAAHVEIFNLETSGMNGQLWVAKSD